MSFVIAIATFILGMLSGVWIATRKAVPSPASSKEDSIEDVILDEFRALPTHKRGLYRPSEPLCDLLGSFGKMYAQTHGHVMHVVAKVYDNNVYARCVVTITNATTNANVFKRSASTPSFIMLSDLLCLGERRAWTVYDYYIG